MASRLLLILMLLVQQLALPAAASRAEGAEECIATSCCQVVETRTCCGDVVREMRCARSGGGACRCGVRPDDSDPAPESPRSPDRTEIGPIFVASIGSVIVGPASATVRAAHPAPAIVRSHNETRSLLCIWRT